MAKRALRVIRIEGNEAFVPLTKGYTAVIDAADVALIDKWNWCALVQKRKDGSAPLVYAKRDVYLGNGKARPVLMHRLIFGDENCPQVDHQDRDGLNNRRRNLRAATRSQNMCNQRIGSRNASGHKGVSWHKRAAKWQAHIAVDGVKQYLGLFTEIEQAAEAYRLASLSAHGEFARIR